MGNKKLNEQELGQVNGGAVRPLKGSEAPEVDETMIVGASKILLCSACGQLLHGADGEQGHGTVTCSCGTVNRY